MSFWRVWGLPPARETCNCLSRISSVKQFPFENFLGKLDYRIGGPRLDPRLGSVRSKRLQTISNVTGAVALYRLNVATKSVYYFCLDQNSVCVHGSLLTRRDVES